MDRVLLISITALALGAFAWFYTGHKNDLDSSLKTVAAKGADSFPNADPNFSDTNYSEWKPYEAGNGKFKAILPGVAQKASTKVHDEKTNESVHFSSYFAQDSKGVAYLINVLAYPEMDNKNEGALLEETVQDMVKTNPKNKLIDSKPSAFRGQKAIDFSIENGNSKVLGTVFRKGTHLFILMATSELNDIDQKDFKYFVDSFEPLTEELKK